MTEQRCPCSHPFDPDAYGCTNCEDYPGCCDSANRERRRRCKTLDCDENDGIHSYGDGCAMARDPG